METIYRHRNENVQAVRVIGAAFQNSGLFNCNENIPSWLADLIAKGTIKIKSGWFTSNMSVWLLKRTEPTEWEKCNSGDWIVKEGTNIFIADNDFFQEQYVSNNFYASCIKVINDPINIQASKDAKAGRVDKLEDDFFDEPNTTEKKTCSDAS